MRISLDKIAGDPGQPRKDFDAADLDVLAASIQENGLMQPITVRPADEKGSYWIVAGERRYRAHVLLRERGVSGFNSIDALVKEPPTTADLRVRQIVENIARADLKPLEEARAFQDLLDHGLSEVEAAKKLGVKHARVQSMLSLLKLTPEIQTMVAGNQIDKAQALELARVKHSDQIKLVQMLNRGELRHWKQLKSAVDAIADGWSQATMFGDAPVASNEDVATLNAMERKIQNLSDQLAAGWKNGECIVATKVSPDRATLMADKLAAIRQAVRRMEQELRNVTAQAKIVS